MNDPKAPAAAGVAAATTPKRTLVESGTSFKGSLTSSCPIVVNGTLEGDVEGPAMTVSSTGSVSGIVVSTTLQSAGKIGGDFDVESATVAGTVAKDTVIRAQTMDLKLNASADNRRLELKFGSAPADGKKGRA